MEVKDATNSGAWVYLSQQELLAIANALNEVCNGLRIEHFQTRIGVPFEDATLLLKAVGSLFDTVFNSE